MSELTALHSAVNKATDYAKEKNISVAVYKKAGAFAFSPAINAVQLGYSIIRIIPQPSVASA